MKRLTFALVLSIASLAGTGIAAACDCMQQKKTCECGGAQSCACQGMTEAPAPTAQKHEAKKAKPDTKRREAAR
jgi:hypothetical protein